MKDKNEKMNSLKQGSNQGPSNPLATALSITPQADDGKMKKKQKSFTITVFAIID